MKQRSGPEYEAFLVKKKFVIENYPTMTNEDLVKQTGLELYQIKGIANANKIKKETSLWKRYVPEFYKNKEEILYQYKTADAAKLPTVAKSFGITLLRLKNFAIKNGVYRNPKHSNIKDNRNSEPLVLKEGKELKLSTDGEHFCETSYARTTTTI